MSSPKRYSDYDDFAWMYNRHWGNQFTPIALAVIEKLVLPEIPKNASILDLCCGTGQLARILSERGYVVTGIDGSKEMLKFAKENAPVAEFMLDDARTFKLPEKYDVVVSVFDSLNHVMTIDELTAVFENVCACLKSGGLFQFDMNLEQGYLTNWKGCNGIVEDDHICVFPNSYDPERKIGQADFTMFRYEDGYWNRSDVKLIQKCYAEEEIRSALGKAGFRRVEAYSYDAGRGLAPVSPESTRAFFLCQR
jgi:SAM-dependent methyltransferase